MADRVLLPSRKEAAKRAGQLRAEGLSFTAQYLALDAIASGRLVDREAIDYEAAIALARTFRNLEWNHRAVRVVVDAALPDQEV